MELETQRLLLREFVADDWRAVLAYQGDPLYLRFYDWDTRSEADARAFVNMFIAYQLERPRTKYQLAMTLKEDGALIGNAGIRVNDTRLREANIGYELDSLYWNQGFATEAAAAVLAFGFETLHVHRVWAECVAENAASVRVLAKLGMRREGCEREKYFIKGRWHDRLIFAMLDREWRAAHPLPENLAPY
jgi:RimJ/RimL family protein N-acetyltransferase